MSSERKIMDGGIAATYVAFALCDVATIYPITPVAEMGEMADKWGIEGRKNLMGQPMIVRELESELGAAGAAHGSLVGGALTTTFTNSQGLLLMIPNMYKISGELLPGVFHIATRSLSAHALSIFGDHQDIMACRQTGFSFLASASVQECMDLGLVAHLSAIEGSLPFVHFFDGWRTSSEIQTIEVIPYEDMRPLVNWEMVRSFRENAMNPEHPHIRGTAEGPEVYFQNREAPNKFYDALPGIVDSNMRKVEKLTGRSYHLFDYIGAPDAEYVLVSMASSCEVIEEAVGYLTKQGMKVGAIKVRLYRPFSVEHFMKAIPSSAKLLCVLDRSKEPGATGDPLFQEVCTALHLSDSHLSVIAGRYGLSSKEFTPSMVKAIFDMMTEKHPKKHFTIGITDDVTHLSIPVCEEIITTSADMVQCKFYGIGADGTVGATKQAASLVGNNTDLYAQAYFMYSAKKSGGYTISELRFSKSPIRSAYLIRQADYVGCNKDTYVNKFDLLKDIKENGVFVLNSGWNEEDMETKLPASLKRDIANKKIRFYNIDAQDIAEKTGLGVRTNMIMETIFLKLINVLDFEKAVTLLKEDIKTLYIKEGADVVQKNYNAVDMAVSALKEINYPVSWKTAVDVPVQQPEVPFFISHISRPLLALKGNDLPVSLLNPAGIMPMGTTAYEKRCIAVNIPEWNPDKCVECCHCSFVCAHAAIRPVLATEEELKNAPATFKVKPADGEELKDLSFRIQVYPEDCLGCASCANICPGNALTMKPLQDELETQKINLDYFQRHITIKDNLLPRDTVKGSQLQQPLLEFSGACAACGETPYVKLLTQLFGERMIIANATGCSSIWGASMPSMPYTVNKNGHGPAWGNSLFEDNAEYGYGIATAIEHRRERLIMLAERALLIPELRASSVDAIKEWLQFKDDPQLSYDKGQILLKALNRDNMFQEVEEIISMGDLLGKKTIWSIGGDGWAYDIGYAGLDHILATKQNINILVMDTECYSNTGGQTSKATPLGAIAKYNANGKRTRKKDLARMEMIYGDIYVASICLGADKQQTINAMMEAEAFDGPSLLVAYCPCINQGIRKGMGMDIIESADAVSCGYWPLFRYNPMLISQGKSPLTVDYETPNGKMEEFLDGEDRYADLKMTLPKIAAILQPELQSRCDDIYKILTSTQKME